MEPWLLGCVAAACAAYDRVAKELFLFAGVAQEKQLMALQLIWTAEYRVAVAEAIAAKDWETVAMIRKEHYYRAPVIEEGQRGYVPEFDS